MSLKKTTNVAATPAVAEAMPSPETKVVKEAIADGSTTTPDMGLGVMGCPKYIARMV